MTHFTDRPIPIIALHLCDGCGLCVRACPTYALELRNNKAVVANPLACEYSGLCEAVCPTQAITRPFEIVWNSPKDIDKDENGSGNLGTFSWSPRSNLLSPRGDCFVGKNTLLAMADFFIHTVHVCARRTSDNGHRLSTLSSPRSGG